MIHTHLKVSRPLKKFRAGTETIDGFLRFCYYAGLLEKLWSGHGRLFVNCLSTNAFLLSTNRKSDAHSAGPLQSNWAGVLVTKREV